MVKILLTDTFIENLAVLLGEDFTQRGNDPHMINDSKGLYVESLFDVIGAEYFDDNASILICDDKKFLSFLKFNNETIEFNEVFKNDLITGDCLLYEGRFVLVTNNYNSDRLFLDDKKVEWEGVTFTRVVEHDS